MKLKTKAFSLSNYEDILLIPFTHNQRERVQLLVSDQKDIDYDIEIKEHREKRSLDANAYFWVLVGKMADILQTSTDELYSQLLHRYGQYQTVSVISEGLDILLKEIEHYQILGEAELNGKTFVHVNIFIGSSKYNSKQMSTLIDGTVSEAKELKIDTMTPNELAKLKSSWIYNS